MRPWRTARPDDGSAAVEFVTAGMLLLVPLVYLVLTLASLQSAAFATEGAAREAARILAREADPATGRDAAERAILVALGDVGMTRSAATARVQCVPRCGDGALTVTVSVRAEVRLPFVPQGLAVVVPVEGEATFPVSRFRPDAP
jgi:Flp pilus assembly protein TadG